MLDELKKVRATISVIERSSLVLKTNSYSKPSSSIIKALKGERRVRTALKPVNKFLEKGKLDEKISFALTKLKTGYKEDILAVLIENRPEIDVIKLQNAVGVRLS